MWHLETPTNKEIGGMFGQENFVLGDYAAYVGTAIISNYAPYFNASVLVE